MKNLNCFFTLAVISILIVSYPGEIKAQKAPKCVKVVTTKRPTILKLDLAELNKFYLNFEQGKSFENLKTAKTDLSYYLLAQELNGNRIFAFELEQKGKRLFLNKYMPVQTCDIGDLSLDTFLKEEGKISGCRLGNYTFKQLPKE